MPHVVWAFSNAQKQFWSEVFADATSDYNE